MRKKHLAVLTKTLFLAAAILMPCGYARAQKLKYVTFFPIPFGSHSDIFVKNRAILGAGHNAEIIFKDNINLSSKLDGSDLELKELWLSPLLENNTDNHDIPTAALGGVYAAKIDVDALNNNTYNLGAESFFKLSKSDDKGIINFDHSDFSFTSDSAIDYTVHSGTLSLGKKGSYKKPLLFHNANNGAIGSIDTSDCKRFCWVQLKLPKEKYFKRYLVCHNQDTCPKTGYEPVNRTQPLYYNFYVMAYGGKGFFTQGAYDQNNNGTIDELNASEMWMSPLGFGFSSDDMTNERTQNGLELGPGYNLNPSPEITYYYSEKSNLKLPELTIHASYDNPQKILFNPLSYPYGLITAPVALLGARDWKLGYSLISDITLTLPDPPVSDDPANGAVRLDERPPDCPAGASGETICLKAQAKNYRCIRRTLYNPSIDTKVDLMRAASLLPETAKNGVGKILLHNRKKWEFEDRLYGTSCSDESVVGKIFCGFSVLGYAAFNEIKYCCPSLTDNTCIMQPARSATINPPTNYVLFDSFFVDAGAEENKAQGLYKDSVCTSYMTGGCTCHILKVDRHGWAVNTYDPRHFFLRLRYYTPQWENIATMIECQNTEYKEDGLY